MCCCSVLSIISSAIMFNTTLFELRLTPALVRERLLAIRGRFVVSVCRPDISAQDFYSRYTSTIAIKKMLLDAAEAQIELWVELYSGEVAEANEIFELCLSVERARDDGDVEEEMECKFRIPLMAAVDGDRHPL